MKKILFVIIMYLFVLPTICYGAPSISTFDDMTISGSSFGTAPDILFFDDFEGGTDGNDLDYNNAAVGDYDEFGVLNRPYYTDDIVVSGDLAFQGDMSPNGSPATIYLPSGTNEIFVDWHLALPVGSNPPAGDDGLGINWKQMWVLGSSTADDDLVIPTILGALPDKSDIDYASYYVNGNDFDPGYRNDFTDEIEQKFVYGQFLHWMCYMKGGFSNDGAFSFWEVYSGGVNQIINDTGVNTLKSGGEWEEIVINAYGRKTTDCYPTFDDVYIATGSSCQARVVVGNSSIFDDCTKTAIQVADDDNWSSDEILLQHLNQGAFSNFEQCYLFVIDSTGTASAGLEVYFSGGFLYSVSATAPVISTISDTSFNDAQTDLTITGTNFGSAQGSGSVAVGGSTQTIQSWSDTEIVFAADISTLNEGEYYDLVVTEDGAEFDTYSNVYFNLTTTPTISTVSDTTIEDGQTGVTISGSDFGSIEGTVSINGVSQTVTSWSDTSITFTVVKGANAIGVSYNLIVTDISSNNSSGYAVQYTPQPTGSVVMMLGSGEFSLGSGTMET